MIKISNEEWEKAKETMCDYYCFYVTVSQSEEVLNLHCEECPMNNIAINEDEL